MHDVMMTLSRGATMPPVSDGGGRGRPAGGRRASRRMPPVQTVVEAVADDLRGRVLNGEFDPGTQLRENDLLDDYGIARHGIRSALHALAHDGLLVHEPHRGVFVPESDPAEIEDILRLRLVLESDAIERVIEQDAPTDGVAAALEQLEAVSSDAPWSELLAADLAIHQAIVDAVGSPRMSRIQSSLIAESALLLAFHLAKDRESEAIRPLHRKLVKSILAGDDVQARALLEDDLEQGLAVIRKGE